MPPRKRRVIESDEEDAEEYKASDASDASSSTSEVEQSEDEEELIKPSPSSKKASKKTASTKSSQKKSQDIDVEDCHTKLPYDHAPIWHEFSDVEEIVRIRTALLDWYDNQHRVLPWRINPKTSKSSNPGGPPDAIGADPDADPAIHGYGVWISEVMLQQTRVSTVIDYFQRWMKKFPTIQALADATAEQVNEQWAGLGFYQRARNLHNGAKFVVSKFGGKLPSTASELIKIPGIGPYTAGAISSIAFSQVEPLVDGNVVRVFSRLRALAADPKSATTHKFHWGLAKALVDPDRPGDFNQSLMDFGATLCTPQSPDCANCPLSFACHALEESKRKPLSTPFSAAAAAAASSSSSSSEASPMTCRTCEKYNINGKQHDCSNTEVTDYPPTAKKIKQRDETIAVGIVHYNSQYLIIQRPDTGLLANLWEFPAIEVPADAEELDRKKRLNSFASSTLSIDLGHSSSIIASRKHVGRVKHLFSHIKQTLVVESIQLSSMPSMSSSASSSRATRWITEDELNGAAIPTVMKKVFTLFSSAGKTSAKKPSSASKRSKKNEKSEAQVEGIAEKAEEKMEIDAVSKEDSAEVASKTLSCSPSPKQSSASSGLKQSGILSFFNKK